MREAAAMIATSRWAYASALARSESRGMHRRLDAPDTDPGFVCALEAAGLDRVSISRREIGRGASTR
jgi:succinate dehydrogenase/fumarate reductase flavoprotein subunit